jgi:hypothetical protein
MRLLFSFMIIEFHQRIIWSNIEAPVRRGVEKAAKHFKVLVMAFIEFCGIVMWVRAG